MRRFRKFRTGSSPQPAFVLITRTGKAASRRIFFRFLELRYKAQVYQLTGCVVECPLDEVNTPRGHQHIQLRIPPTDSEIDTLFRGWRAETATTRRFATCARNYAAASCWPEWVCGSTKPGCSTWTTSKRSARAGCPSAGLKNGYFGDYPNRSSPVALS